MKMHPNSIPEPTHPSPQREWPPNEEIRNSADLDWREKPQAELDSEARRRIAKLEHQEFEADFEDFCKGFDEILREDSCEENPTRADSRVITLYPKWYHHRTCGIHGGKGNYCTCGALLVGKRNGQLTSFRADGTTEPFVPPVGPDSFSSPGPGSSFFITDCDSAPCSQMIEFDEDGRRVIEGARLEVSRGDRSVVADDIIVPIPDGCEPDAVGEVCPELEKAKIVINELGPEGFRLASAKKSDLVNYAYGVAVLCSGKPPSVSEEDWDETVKAAYVAASYQRDDFQALADSLNAILENPDARAKLSKGLREPERADEEMAEFVGRFRHLVGANTGIEV